MPAIDVVAAPIGACDALAEASRYRRRYVATAVSAG
jgi:hypothetical protein